MDYFNKNLSLLSVTQPDLAAQIAAYASPANNIEVIAAKNGSYTFRKNVNGTVHTAHSGYDPQKEAVRMVDGYMQEMIDFSSLIVLGGGFYYHIEELISRVGGKFDFMLIVEHDADIFKNALRCRDLSAVLGRPDIVFAVAESPVGLFRFLQGKSISIVANELTMLKHPALCKTTDYYSQVEKQVKDVCTWARVNISAQVKTTDTYCRNIFKNIPTMLKNPGINKLFNMFEGVPAVVVAAGPSLNKNISQLHEVKNKFLIVAVDTALKVLLRNGIEPHIVASIDYTPDNMRYFEGVDEIKTYLAADPEVYPDIFSKYRGPKISVDLYNKSLCSWLQQQGIDKGAMHKGLSVAHTCFEIAKEAGCSPIVFVGQDLAYSGGLSHAKGAAMAVSVDGEGMEEGKLKVEDIFGGEVETSTSMSVFINHFAEKIYTSGCKCIDATEGGAKIAGTDIMSLRHVIYEYGDKGCDDVFAKIKDVFSASEKIDINKIKSNAKAIVKQFKEFASFASGAEKAMDELIESVKPEDIDVVAVSKCLKAWQAKSVQMHKFDSLLKILRDNITDALVVHAKKSLVITSLGDLREESERKKVRAAADRDRFFYGKIKKSALFMACEFEKLYGEL